MNKKYGLEQVSVRMIREAPLLSDEKIQNPQDAIRILGDVFKDYGREDIAITNRMQQLCMLAGIPVVDHIIIGQKELYCSFREKDILPMDDIKEGSMISLKEADEKFREEDERQAAFNND